MAEKSAQNIIDGVEKSKQIPFEKSIVRNWYKTRYETVAKEIGKEFQYD